MDEFHKIPYVGHLGHQKMVTTIRQLYYWLGMKQDIAQHISKCLEFQQVKVEHKHPSSLLKPLSIPEWKCETISMDFIKIIPKIVKQHDVIMVVVDKLRKVAHFVPIKSTFKYIDVANIFMKEIFGLHGFPKTIIVEKIPSSLQIFGEAYLQA
jgi:hypothetical protein